MPENEIITPRKGQTLDSVQALRGIAATIVMLFHLAGRELAIGKGGFGFLHPFLFFGAQGVDLFFVISGFIITWTNFESFGKPEKIPVYFARRITRIFPLYWVFFILILITAGLGLNHAIDHATTFGNMVGIILLLPYECIHIVPVSWTLTFEFFFYCLFGLALRWDRRRFPLVLLGWFLLVMVATIFPAVAVPCWPPVQRIANIVLSIRTIEFMFGCCIALWLGRRQLSAPPLWFLSGVVFFAMAAHWLSLLQAAAIPPGLITLFGIGSAGIVVGAVGHELRHGGRFVPRWLVTLGDASYSLYLAHLMVIASLQRILGPLNRPTIAWHLLWLASLGASGLAGALLTYRFVEAPLLNSAGKAIRRHLSR